MKSPLLFCMLSAALMLAVVSRAAEREPAIVVTIEWLNYKDMKCQSCETQNITLDANSYAILGAKCDGRTIYVKVLPRWKGEAIEVGLSMQSRQSDGKFVEREARSTLVAKGDAKEVVIEGFKYRISAAKASEQKKEPNQPPQTNAGSRPRPDASPASETPSSPAPRG